jgi:hypothetical protein
MEEINCRIFSKQKIMFAEINLAKVKDENKNI